MYVVQLDVLFLAPSINKCIWSMNCWLCTVLTGYWRRFPWYAGQLRLYWNRHSIWSAPPRTTLYACELVCIITHIHIILCEWLGCCVGGETRRDQGVGVSRVHGSEGGASPAHWWAGDLCGVSLLPPHSGHISSLCDYRYVWAFIQNAPIINN